MGLIVDSWRDIPRLHDILYKSDGWQNVFVMGGVIFALCVIYRYTHTRVSVQIVVLQCVELAANTLRSTHLLQASFHLP